MNSDTFYRLIESMASEIEVEILKCQGINNVPALLRAKDLYSIFKIDSEDLEDLKNRATLKLKDGEYMIRPAIKNNLEFCINTFRNKLNEKHCELEPSDPVSNTQADCFMSTFIEGLTKNMNRSKYRYEYNTSMRRFASSVYALGGRNVYQYLQLNLPGAFPTIPTLDSYNKELCKRIQEGEFRFQELENYSNKISSYTVYASEDCTGVIANVYYDVETNSFVGFCPTLNNGLPTIRQYETDDFFQFEDWFESVERSTLMNLYTIQHITGENTPPFILSGFGTNNKINSVSVLQRWLFIYQQCYNRNIRLLGLSSDADPKYLKCMRLVTGYFANLSNSNLLDRADLLEVHIPESWLSWFYIRQKQLFLCFQDSTHIATKLRNRLLTHSTSLKMGSFPISIQNIENLIHNYSKLEHNLVISDIYVTDKQNYKSCMKISSENILRLLNQNKKTYGTHCYLTMIQFVTNAYIDKTTNILKRIFYAWCIVFIGRLWFMWLRFKLFKRTKTMRQTEKPTMRKIEENFISFPAFYSIELNAHVLTFILLLVLNKTLPIESLNICLFSSQPCENMFRCARAVTGPFSTMTNFTVQEFLFKARKISILNEIKTLEGCNTNSNAIKFPIHHKQHQSNLSSSMLINLDGITIDKIEENVNEAYEYAKSFMEKLEMSSLLKKNNVFKLNDLCLQMRNDLESMIYITDDCTLDSDDNLNESTNHLDEQTTNSYLSPSDSNDDIDHEHDSDAEDEGATSTKDRFNAMRIYSSIADKDKKKYFKITINGVEKLMHKQTAVWYLTKKKNQLSSDRLVRVQKTNRQE